MKRKRSILVAALALAGGCQAKDRTFLSVDVCLGSPENVAPFKQQMQSIARDEGMKFVDGSDEPNGDLAALNAQAYAPQPFVNIGIDDEHGTIVMGGNLGLTNRQVSLGFREGQDDRKDRAFADRVVSTLKHRWRVEIVAPDKGSFPMKGC
ncbi:MAG: hypothetical protein ABIQ43_04745 [Sphingomonas sp.]